jgi:hypothetical protein
MNFHKFSKIIDFFDPAITDVLGHEGALP